MASNSNSFVQIGPNAQFYALGCLLPVVKFVGVQQVISAPSTHFDMYTCPPNRRAFIYNYSIFNPGAIPNATTLYVKIGGVYYQISVAVLTTGGTNTQANQNPFWVLEGGQSYSANSGNGGQTVFLNIIEFDGAAPLRTVYLLSLAAGDNVLYTCPTGKSAICNTNISALNLYSSYVVKGNDPLDYWNLSGATRTVQYNMVLAGSSVSSANQLVPAGSVATGSPAGNTTGLNNICTPITFNPGDSFHISTDDPSATQYAYISVFEI